MKSMMCLIDKPKSTLVSSAFKTHALCAFLCASIVLLTQSLSIAAEENQPPQLTITESNTKFEYILENRADPFVPFITEKAATSSVDMNEIIDTSEPLTGMQLFEPGQLTLVALLKKEHGNVAMVEDFTGKGYILLKGTKIGRRGVVKDIAPNTVVIEETAVTRAGKEIITKIVMTLKKEGEE